MRFNGAGSDRARVVTTDANIELVPLHSHLHMSQRFLGAEKKTLHKPLFWFSQGMLSPPA